MEPSRITTGDPESEDKWGNNQRGHVLIFLSWGLILSRQHAVSQFPSREPASLWIPFATLEQNAVLSVCTIITWGPREGAQNTHPRSPYGGLFSSVQSLSRVQLFATPWTAARQASLSTTNSSLNNYKRIGDFPGGSVVRTLHFSLLRAWVQSLLWELRSHKLCLAAKKKMIKELKSRWVYSLVWPQGK